MVKHFNKFIFKIQYIFKTLSIKVQENKFTTNHFRFFALVHIHGQLINLICYRQPL
jgi:hypothetical protein